MDQNEYNVIYADPPWHYKVYSKKGEGRSADSHYPTMSIEDIRALPVGQLAAKDCALFLWVTFPCLIITMNWKAPKANSVLSVEKAMS